MNQLQRRYLRLEELPQKTNLTQGDIFEAVENGDLPLCASVQVKNLGAYISPTSPTDRALVSIFNYSGVIRLLSPDSRHFSFSHEPHLCKIVGVLEPHGISNWRSIDEAFDNVTEANVKYKQILVKQPDKPFFASGQVSADSTFNSSLGAFVDMVSSFAPKNDDLNKLVDQYPKTNAKRLEVNSLQVKFEQLRVDINDLKRVFGAESLKTKVSSIDDSNLLTGAASVKLTVNHSLLTHPIAQIAYRILQANPEARADKVWALLRKDIEQHEFNRVYDVDSVVETITQDDITWFGRGDEENTMSYDSFRKNVLVGARKALKVEKG